MRTPREPLPGIEPEILRWIQDKRFIPRCTQAYTHTYNHSVLPTTLQGRVSQFLLMDRFTPLRRRVKSRPFDNAFQQPALLLACIAITARGSAGIEVDLPGLEPEYAVCHTAMFPLHHKPKNLWTHVGVEPTLLECETSVLPLTLMAQGGIYGCEPTYPRRSKVHAHLWKSGFQTTPHPSSIVRLL